MSILSTIREAGFDPREWPGRGSESEPGPADSFPLLRGIMVAVPISMALWALIIFSIRWMLG